MDNKTVFVRTSKGEDEVHSRTMHLPGDIKRALMMVDGAATFAEISKRAAPSLRVGLEAMLQELEKDGFIADKAKAGVTPKMSAPPRMSVPPKMSAPPRMVSPHKPQTADEGAGDLDFMSGFGSSSSNATEAEAEKSAADAEKLKAEAEDHAKQEAEAAKIKAQQEAEAILHKAEQEAASIREEAELEKQREAAKAKTEAQTRSLIEAKATQEIEAARIKAENEARARAEEKVRQEIEIARLQAQQEAEAARTKAAREVAKAREETAASLRARQKAEAMLIKQANELNEADKPRPGVASTSRTTSATVLFFDVVGYTRLPVNKQIEIKKQFNELVSACLRVEVEDERIILDTGDGAAIGFLQHPEDALEVAMKFRTAVIANQHLDFPDLKVRIGIHLGPINIAKDMNGRSNMVGDGINDAQRVMSFAGIDQIYISRAYYDFVSRLKDEYADMFRYRGMLEDKHGREHPVYEFVGSAPVGNTELSQASVSHGEVQPNPFYSSAGTDSQAKSDTFAFEAFRVDEPQSVANQQIADQPVQKTSPAGTSSAAKPETFSFDSFKIELPETSVESPTKEKISPAQQQEDDASAARHPEIRKSVKQETSRIIAGKPAGDKPSQEEIQRATHERIVVEKRMDEEALAAKKHAEAQEKAHVDAEQRKAEAARAEMEQAAKQAKYSVDDATHISHVAKSAPVARVRRKPFSWGKLLGFFFKLGVFLLLLLVGALFAIPHVLPTRDYIPKVEKLLSEKLHQPVHIGYLSGRILPTPRLELGEVYIGDVKQFQAEQTLIDFAITGLIIDAKPIDNIELLGVKVSGAALQNVSAWLQQLSADSQYPVARMVISRGTLDADVIQFTSVEGVLDFNKFGEFTKANLRSNGGKYTLDINAPSGGNPQVAISVRGSALPLFPNWPFDELTAKGVLSSNNLSISEFNGQIVGGVLKGNATIDWHSGWRAQGSMAAKSISMQRLNNLLEGNIEGSARFKMTSVNLAGLAGSAVLEGDFTSKNGLISGMDIVETARKHSREHLPGGRTHFDELSGMFTYADNTIHFRQVKITTNVLNGVATLDIDKQQISGSITVKLTLQDVLKPVELQIGGVTDIPVLRFSP